MIFIYTITTSFILFSRSSTFLKKFKMFSTSESHLVFCSLYFEGWWVLLIHIERSKILFCFLYTPEFIKESHLLIFLLSDTKENTKCSTTRRGLSHLRQRGWELRSDRNTVRNWLYFTPPLRDGQGLNLNSLKGRRWKGENLIFSFLSFGPFDLLLFTLCGSVGLGSVKPTGWPPWLEHSLL